MSNNFATQLAKELHKVARKNYPTASVRQQKVDRTWSADLSDLNDLVQENDGFRYLLCIIDIGSRYAWVVPLKEKSAGTVVQAFSHIMSSSKRQPQLLWVDQGSEFKNAQMNALLTSKHIEMYHTFGKSKAAFVERFQRTLKTNMWKYFTEHQTRKWTNVLERLVHEYNEARHSSIGMSPKAASKSTTLGTESTASREMTPADQKRKTKFEPGDLVRVSKKKGVFEKGYEASWSLELYTVASVKKQHGQPDLYELRDRHQKLIKGSFYAEELQKSKVDPNEYLVEKLGSTKTIKGKKYVFVHWIGRTPSWEPYTKELFTHEYTR